ncbi:extracellular solute-binding protein [Thauera sinica]|uniref:Extracellular solute-binding protein n=1 Tax=Thauera sinica TaxID=2665146 RepID=A0ABW1AMH5_9RHOO|nr:extracellular solute-binding protein [Thauera sp. K11]ATE59162.1 ABC transporter substrate-binding protein [Thauera sp. K11]
MRLSRLLPFRRLQTFAFLALCLHAGLAQPAHGVAYFGAPRYPAGFTHFDYVDPQAPKGGSLVQGNIALNSNFDKLNPFSLKGVPAPGLLELVFETLAVYSLDESNTQYGLLAEDIEVAADFRSVTFRLNRRARFSNGDPVTADDVKHSFDTLTSKKASPKFRNYFAEIEKVVVVDAGTVRFDYRRAGRDLAFVAGSLPVFSPKWGVQPDGTRTAFDALKLDAPISSGPYVIERLDGSQGVVYRRNPDYWAADVPSRRGMFNFDRIVYKLYKDQETLIAGLRSGEFDILVMPQSRVWCCHFIGKRFDSGELLKSDFAHKNPPAMNGYAFNLRREQFQDLRVRQALNLVFDFEWVNQRIFHDDWERTDSYFPNSALKATGLPSAAELELLEPWRGQLDPAVFGPPVAQPTTRAPSSYRENLGKALELMEAAGWTYRDGVLRNAGGEPFVMEVPASRSQSPYMDPLYRNFSQLGVQLKRVINDAATQRKRMNRFDFDFATISFREGRMPGAELLRNLGSAGADKPGSENIVGLKSPAVDALVRKVIDAGSQEELETAARALDRVLMHGHYVIPFRHIARHHVVHHRRLARPERLPDYYGPYEWIQATWWERR